jgi:membrane protein DedA with SNARE-associated domain
MHSARWFISVLSAISFLVGLSALSIAHFLLHQSLGTSLWIGNVAVIIAIFEGSWRLSCKEKNALDPQWREKARAEL